MSAGETAAIDFAVADGAPLKPEQVVDALRECYDPEIPVNIVDLGLVYGVTIAPQRVDVRMTLTASSGSWWSVADVRAYTR